MTTMTSQRLKTLIEDFDKLRYFDNSIVISQRKYALDILEKTGFMN